MGKATASKKRDDPLVNPFAARQGNYEKATISVTAGEFPDEPYHKQRQVTINRGGSTMRRWIATGQFNPTQLNAMDHYSRAWHKVFQTPSVVANLSPMAFIRGDGNAEAVVATIIDARELLRFLDERIFDMAPAYYKDTWQDAVIYDSVSLPEGGKARMSETERCKTIVLFIADMIATNLRL